MKYGHAAEQAPTRVVGALPAALPADLAIAINVAQRMLTDYGDSRRDGFRYAAAYGAVRESLRILLRALDAEPDVSAIADTAPRCPAAPADDPTSCNGPAVVTVLDPNKRGANGCEHHAARLIAALPGAYPIGLPDAPAGAAVRVFKAAGDLRGGETR